MISIYDVLKASKGIHVDDTFANLWGRKLSNAYTLATYTGTLPATLQTVAGYLESYKIYGNTEQAGTPTPESPIVPSGCGERTENLFDKDNTEGIEDGYYIDRATGDKVRNPQYFVSAPIAVTSEETYCWVFRITSGGAAHSAPTVGFFDASDNQIGVASHGVSIKSFSFTTPIDCAYIRASVYKGDINEAMLVPGSTAPASYIPYGYKLPFTSGSTSVDIYIGDDTLSDEEYVDSTTGKIYRRTKNLSPPEEEWTDEWIWGDGTVHPSTEIKTSPFIDVSTCETCIMEVFSAETEWVAAGYREMAFYDENKQYLGRIGGGERRALTPNSSEMLSEFPAGTVYVRIGCSHNNQPFYPQLVSGYTPTHRFYPYIVPTDPPTPFPQIPTFAGTTVIDYNSTPKPDKVELTYRKRKGQ